MDTELTAIQVGATDSAIREMEAAVAAPKCWRCGCLHGTISAIRAAIPQAVIAPALATVLDEGQQVLEPPQYDCLGCSVCWPANAINLLGVPGDTCATAPVEVRAGWPPLPGSYQVVRYQASVAICTLTDTELANTLVRLRPAEVGIVGTMHTENLGIERLLQNVLANPHLRVLVLCGPDSQQAIGHLPGQSLRALATNGLDEQGRILGAHGKRPVIRNLSPEAVEHFRQTVEVIDLIGEVNPTRILVEARDRANILADPGEAFEGVSFVPIESGALPPQMRPDPAGYVVVDVDLRRGYLRLEHYANTGVLDLILQGTTAAELYTPLIERSLISRLDHAAYVGRELARAELALQTGVLYIQDGVQERLTKGTDSPCASTCPPEPI